MNAFVQQHKTLLKFYHSALRLSGWILLIVGICNYPITMLLARTLDVHTFSLVSISLPLRMFPLILFGLLGLAIAQLIQYLVDSTSKPGLLVRHGSKFLCIYVVLMLIMVPISNFHIIRYISSVDIPNTQRLFFITMALVTSIILFATQALILLGAAQFLKRLLPIIEEHKSLV